MRVDPRERMCPNCKTTYVWMAMENGEAIVWHGKPYIKAQTLCKYEKSVYDFSIQCPKCRNLERFYFDTSKCEDVLSPTSI